MRQYPSSELVTSIRAGIGNDLHGLVPGRKLVLGGVRIPFAKGLLGHSDGDALAHAICDALLGAAALGDIGQHFPNTSPKWRGVSSLLFLRQVRKLLRDAGYAIVNVDATVGLERPKLVPHIPRMQKKLARALGLNAAQVSVKAKTGEGLDAVGRGEAVRADAVALISLVEKSRVEKLRSAVRTAELDSRFRGNDDAGRARRKFRHSRESGNPSSKSLLVPESQKSRS